MTRTRRLAAAYIALAAAVAVLFALNLFWGSVSLAPGAVLTALLTALVLYLMTPHTEIRSLTGFRCYFVPRCEVNYQSYHRDNDLYNMGIYKLNGQDAARFVYWAQENGWSPMPLSDEALTSGMLNEETCPEAAEIKQVTQGLWKQPNGMALFVFDSQTATLYIRKMPR